MRAGARHARALFATRLSARDCTLASLSVSHRENLPGITFLLICISSLPGPYSFRRRVWTRGFGVEAEAELASVLPSLHFTSCVSLAKKVPVACFPALSLFYGILRAVVGVEVTLLLNRDVEGAVLRVQRHFIKERVLHS